MKIQEDFKVSSIINTLKHEFRIISHGQHWKSASGFHTFLASILGVAGLIWVIKDGKVRSFRYIPFSSDRDTVSGSEKFWVVPGLQNLGNNCFLNVILQALASCSCFRNFLQKVLEDNEALPIEELVDCMPLAVSLDSLLEELCTPRHGREVLSPRKVMLAMDHYNHNFNLTNQQDAEEAFLHILSSLREEIAEYIVPNQSSLADVTAGSTCRILTPERRVAQSEHEKWQQNFLGPIDGILGGILTCQSCSFQISLDFQYFNSLNLPPVLSNGSTIMAGSSVEDCLEQFFRAEQLEHYYCSHCWHIAALKYLSITDENEADVIKLRSCSKQDSCGCRNLSRLGALPWSNRFSRTFKQLNIARSPKILCLHLQRASVNLFGEPVKLQGHISIPLTLNIARFMNSGVQIKSCKEKFPNGQSMQHRLSPLSNSNLLNVQLDAKRFNSIFGEIANNTFSDTVVQEEVRKSAYDVSGNTNVETSQGHYKTGDGSDITVQNTLKQSKYKVSGACHLTHPDIHMYGLVSVVQHFGRAGSGHYTVYRRVRAKLNNKDPNKLPAASQVQWFGISDAEVYSVSEEDVLAAEASVLFYEKNSESRDDVSNTMI